MHIRLIGNFDDRQKGIKDLDVNMVIYYVILIEGKNIVQGDIYYDFFMCICYSISAMRSTKVITGETIQSTK